MKKCPICNISLGVGFTGNFCFHCGSMICDANTNLPCVFSKNPSQLQEIRSIPISTPHDSLIEISFDQNSQYFSGEQNFIPFQIKNFSEICWKSFFVKISIWGQEEGCREIRSLLEPHATLDFAIPFFVKKAGQYLLQSLQITLYSEQKEWTFQSIDEIILKVSSEGKSPSVYNFSIQDYAQVFGNIKLDAECVAWKKLRMKYIDFPLGGSPSIPINYCYIQVKDPQKTDHYYLCSREKAILGRSKQAEFQILNTNYAPTHPKNLEISAIQARIFRDDFQWFLEDCDSQNGTEINGLEIKNNPYPLYDKDILRFAKRLEFEVELFYNTPQELPNLKLFPKTQNTSEDIYILSTKVVRIGRGSEIHIPSLRKDTARIHYLNGYQLSSSQKILHNSRSVGPNHWIHLNYGDRIQIDRVVFFIEKP